MRAIELDGDSLTIEQVVEVARTDPGKLTLRIPPRVHAAIATAAETSGKSLNKWVADILVKAADAG